MWGNAVTNPGGQSTRPLYSEDFEFFADRVALKLLGALLGLAVLVAGALPLAAAPTPDDMGGTLQAEIDGKRVDFPSLKTDIEASIAGDVAAVSVTQTFVNPGTVPLNATYLFPLNRDAAIDFMQMEVGDERITAVIQKKEQARAGYEAAKTAGKAAALLTQHRPNMFTQEVANLMPGQPVKVRIRYSQAVPRIDGAYELQVPLVVGPRYMPQPKLEPQVASDEPLPQPAPKSGVWQFARPPAYPAVSGLDIPDTIDKDRVSIGVSLKAGFPIKNVTSRTHALQVTGGDGSKSVQLADGRSIDNRDFVLRYELAGRTLEAGLLTHTNGHDSYLSLLLEPPAAPASDDITPREMVFVLDTSGSMTGMPIEASKTFMRQALASLRSTDSFRIIRFGSEASEFASSPLPATVMNLMAGKTFVDSLQPGGGTEVMSGLNLAFSVPAKPGVMRIVVMLTDGYIGNEAEILQAVNARRNEARIYAFGVGSSVNRYLLDGLARLGRGMVRYIDPTEDGNTAAIDLAKKLDAPVLTDISIDWGTLKVANVTPRIVPDLFKGDSLRFMARAVAPLERGARHTVTVKGKVNGRLASLPLTLTIATDKEQGAEALPAIWARTQIKDAMDDLMRPENERFPQLSNDEIEAKVTDLGLKHSLMTQWTSFLAVSEKIVNERPDLAADAEVPLNQVAGVSKEAYGENLQRIQQNAKPMQKAQLHMPQGVGQTLAFNAPTTSHGNFGMFGGASTPEPEATGGIALLVLMLAGFFYRRRRAA